MADNYSEKNDLSFPLLFFRSNNFYAATESNLHILILYR